MLEKRVRQVSEDLYYPKTGSVSSGVTYEQTNKFLTPSVEGAVFQRYKVFQRVWVQRLRPVRDRESFSVLGKGSIAFIAFWVQIQCHTD